MSRSLSSGQVTSIVRTIYAANGKQYFPNDRIKASRAAGQALGDTFVSSAELDQALAQRYRKVALSLRDPHHPYLADQIARDVVTGLDPLHTGWIPVDHSWLNELLAGFSGVRRPGFINAEQMKWAMENGRLLVGEGGQLLTNNEAILHQDTVIALHEDSEKGRVVPKFTLERETAFPRPVPPAVDPRPLPPAIDPRPVPPAIDPRPVPPAIDPGMVVPPPVFVPSHGASQILRDFQEAHDRLKAVYNATSMSRSEYEAADQKLVIDAEHELADPFSGSNSERRSAFEVLRKATDTLTSLQAQEIASREAELIVDDHIGLPYSSRSEELKTLYNASPMTSETYDSFDKRLVRQEVDRIAGLPVSFETKVNMINELYNASRMTSMEKDAYIRQLGGLLPPWR